MNYRNLLIASLVTGIVASCSSNPKDETISAVPDINKTNRVDLIEVNASLRPPAPSSDFKLASVTPTQPTITHKRVEFTIGDEGPAQPGSEAGADAGYVENAREPMNPAPSYSERPVPTSGMTRTMVVANHGQPANKLDGKAGTEVWDYGTFRVFFQTDKVAFTRVW